MAQLIGSKGLKGRQKAAALLIALGPEVSAEVLKHFKETDIETLTFEIFQLEKVTEETRGQVLEECYHMAVARDFITSGGADYARDMLQRALGKDKAQEIIERMAISRRPQRFSFARDSDPSQLAQFVSGEHPQTIARCSACCAKSTARTCRWRCAAQARSCKSASSATSRRVRRKRCEKRWKSAVLSACGRSKRPSSAL